MKWNGKWTDLKQVTPLRFATIYAFISGMWILFSDRLLGLVVSDHRTLIQLGTFKGWFYTVVMSVFLYFIFHWSIKSLQASEEALQQSYMDLEATHEELVAAEEELKQQFDEVQEREAYYRRIYEGVSSGIMVQDRFGKLIHANTAACRLLKRNVKQLAENTMSDASWQATYADGSPVCWEALPEIVQFDTSGTPFSREVAISVEDAVVWLLMNCDVVVAPLSEYEHELVITLIDITEDKKIEMYEHLLKEVERRVLQERSLPKILLFLCEQLTQNLKYAWAWVGTKESDGSIAFHAHAGIPDFESVTVRWDESHLGDGAAGRAIRLGKPQVETFEGNARFEAWIDFYNKHQLRSIAAIPLIHQNETFGVLALYSHQNHFFDGPHVRFLEHFANQLAMAFNFAREREHLERYRLLAEHSSEMILFIRPDGRILEANEAALQTYGYSHEEFTHSHVQEICLAADRVQVPMMLKHAADGMHFECLHQRSDGSTFPVEVSLRGATLNGDPIILAIIRDITQRKNAEAQLIHQAHHDALTGLPNRLLFNEHLNQALAQARRKGSRLAVLFLDLDRFKLINDTMGHNAGDHLLQAVTGRLKQTLREGDTMARQGGDEFLILIPELIHEEDAAVISEKILEVFTQPFTLDHREVFISPSIGISLYPTDGLDLETLVKQADTAMYFAKEQGRNNYQFFTKGLNIKAHERLSLENRLRKALEREEFILYYQPQVDLESGCVVGMEALLRWNLGEEGMVSPDVFIPIAEETGLIVPIGKWVLRTACIQSKVWQEQGYSPLRMAVNISARQFQEPWFVFLVAEILQETALDPEWLELEITERIAMENGDASIEGLRQLKELGVRISIDDFGTGFSSLNYLRRLPIDTLKIDQTFIRDISADENGEEVVMTIIQLAKNLRLKVIAEGVETKDQLSFLKDKRCDEMQGYLFSKPLPAEEVERLFVAAKEIRTASSKIMS